MWEAQVPFTNAPDPNNFDVAVFGYPVHAFNTPRFFLRFVKTLPCVGNIPAYIIKTSGEPFRMNNASSRPLVRILRHKGYVPMMEQHLLMPYNIVFRYNDALAKQMYLHTKDMAAVVAGRIAAGTARKLFFSPFAVLISYLFRLQWFGAFVNGPLIHVNKALCTGCGLCAKMCPAQNALMRGGYPRFGRRCTMCMGCAFRCPQDAVRPGLLNPLRVNGPYPFRKLVEDDSIPAEFISESTTGYFGLFRPYYRRTNEEIRALRASENNKSSEANRY